MTIATSQGGDAERGAGAVPESDAVGPWGQPRIQPCVPSLARAPRDGIGHSTVSQPHPRLPQQQDAGALVAAVPAEVEGAFQPLFSSSMVLSCRKVGHWLVS